MKHAIEKVLSPSHALIYGYIVLGGIQLSGLPEFINYDGNRLVRKNEFHISVVNAKKLAELIDVDRQEEIKAEIIDEFQNFITKSKLDQFELLNEFRFVTRDARKTITVMCDFPDGNELFKKLEKRFGKSLPLQPFHITIFSLDPDEGISISSAKELSETKIINIPELEAAKIGVK